MTETEDSLMDAGIAAAERGELEAASVHFLNATRIAPASSTAYLNLSTVLWARGDRDGARAVLDALLHFEPDNPHALINTGVILAEIDELDEAIRRLERGVQVAPAGYSCNNLGLLYRRRGDREAALRLFEQGLTFEPNDWLLRGNRGIELLVLGRFAEGWQEYEYRRMGDDQYETAYGIAGDRKPWDGSFTDHLLVHYEQGFGDTLQHCRYLQAASERCNRLSFIVQPQLVRLMRESWGHNPKITIVNELPSDFTEHVWIDSLPMIFEAGIKPIPNAPYLSMPALPYWRQELDARFVNLRVGLVYAGRLGHKIDERRSMKLEEFKPLLDVPGVDFFSLQIGREQYDERVVDFTPRLTDWGETASFIQELDLVISVDTAVAHLAGALGKPVWMLNRFDTCWRWLTTGTTTEWYPTMRIFRQPVYGDWQSVISDVRNALEQYSHV